MSTQRQASSLVNALANSLSGLPARALSRSGPAIVVIGIHLLIVYVLFVSMGVLPAPEVKRVSDFVFIPDTPIQRPEPVKPIDPMIESHPVPINQPMPQLPPETLTAPVAETPMPQSPTAPVANEPATGAGPSIPTPQRLKVSHRVEPTYPPSARRSGEAGSVQLRILVNERGVPGEIQIVKSSGYTRLDDAAIDAVRRWRFVAATNGNQAIPAWTQLAITFRLTDQ